MKQENLQSLKLTQIHLDALKENYAKLLEEFRNKNQDLIQGIERVSNDENELREKVKIEAIEEFEETGQKKLLGGIGIRILSKLEYSEENAMNWARQNMKIAISEVLDKKQFENYAKSNDLGFVNKKEKASVTFPKTIII